MPHRSYASTANYRFGFNGKENDNEPKGLGNQQDFGLRIYDSRLGKFFSVDPIFKPYESPYSAFGNNPIWNIDSDGADTAKYLNDKQLGDALKIASADVKERLENKKPIYGNDKDERLGRKIIEYIEKNGLTFGQAKEFQSAVSQYHNGLATVAFESEEAFSLIDRGIINDKNINDKNAVTLTVFYVRKFEKLLAADMDAAKKEAMKVVFMAGLPMPVGSGPRGLGINSATAQSIVNAGKPALRLAYEGEVRGLKTVVEAMRGNGNTAEQIARAIHGERRILGMKYKDLTPPSLLEKIYKRNIEKYGDKLGPSIEWLRNKGKSWEEIINSACEPGGADIKF